MTMNKSRAKPCDGCYKGALKDALRNFGDEIAHDCRDDDTRLPWCPIMPLVYPGYWRSRIKMFYIGQDTKDWDLGHPHNAGFHDFFECYDANNFDSYLEWNDKALSLEKRIELASDRRTFWHGVHLLHEKLFFGDSLSKRIEDGRSCLDGLGYCNLNSIELKRTLSYCWDDLAKEKYWKIKKASETYLDRYDLIHDTYKPDCAVVCSWTGSVYDYVERCGVVCKKISDEVTDGGLKIQAYLLDRNGKKSILIWTFHPRTWVKLGSERCADNLSVVIRDCLTKYGVE